MKYFKVYWKARVGMSVIKAPDKDVALHVALNEPYLGDKVICEKFWWSEAELEIDDIRELNENEIETIKQIEK